MLDSLSQVDVVYQTLDLCSVGDAQAAAQLILVHEDEEKEEERFADGFGIPEKPTE